MQNTVIFAGIIVLLVIGLSACAKNLAKKPSMELPEACALLAMPPSERREHERRLVALSRAGRLREKTDEGFAFEVDLRKMPESELEHWLRNEQRCCGFITLSARVVVPGELAQVHVEVPVKLREQMIATFGLKK